MPDDWTAIGLGLGGNVGDVPATIDAALRTLATRGHVTITKVSSLYRTAPWGHVVQPDFGNVCALGTTDLGPRALLAEVKAIEALLGRETTERWGPRMIDIDILFYAGETLEEPNLVIPHESLFERAFVLVPLAEIAPDLVLAGRSIGTAARTIDARGVTRW